MKFCDECPSPHQCAEERECIGPRTFERDALIRLCRKAIMDACVGRERYTVNELLERFDAQAALIPQSEGPSKTKLPASSDAGGGPIHAT